MCITSGEETQGVKKGRKYVYALPADWMEQEDYNSVALL